MIEGILLFLAISFGQNDGVQTKLRGIDSFNGELGD